MSIHVAFPRGAGAARRMLRRRIGGIEERWIGRFRHDPIGSATVAKLPRRYIMAPPLAAGMNGRGR